MWLLQACLRSWARGRPALRVRRAPDRGERRAPRVQSPVRSGSRQLPAPDEHGDGHRDYCRGHAAARARRPAGLSPARFSRVSRSSTGSCSIALEELTGTPIREVQIVGGGSRNRLLNQFTADATGRTVVAGPVEATALGNIAMQMVATGAVARWARRGRSSTARFPVERFEPVVAGPLERALPPLSRLSGVDLCLRTLVPRIGGIHD